MDSFWVLGAGFAVFGLLRGLSFSEAPRIFVLAMGLWVIARIAIPTARGRVSRGAPVLIVDSGGIEGVEGRFMGARWRRLAWSDGELVVITYRMLRPEDRGRAQELIARLSGDRAGQRSA